ncbi:MAG: hypothetical protein S4CHLAM7_08080 [Chlamydiae bacterium]|nr:hypothetical protein [Chlamydiota bacterium]
MKLFIYIILLFSYSFLISTELPSRSIENKRLEIIPETLEKDLTFTELDDMKDLFFLYTESLDPKEPAICIESVAKKQQDEFIKSHILLDLEVEEK